MKEMATSVTFCKSHSRPHCATVISREDSSVRQSRLRAEHTFHIIITVNVAETTATCIKTSSRPIVLTLDRTSLFYVAACASITKSMTTVLARCPNASQLLLTLLVACASSTSIACYIGGNYRISTKILGGCSL